MTLAGPYVYPRSPGNTLRQICGKLRGPFLAHWVNQQVISQLVFIGVIPNTTVLCMVKEQSTHQWPI